MEGSFTDAKREPMSGGQERVISMEGLPCTMRHISWGCIKPFKLKPKVIIFIYIEVIILLF